MSRMLFVTALAWAVAAVPAFAAETTQPAGSVEKLPAQLPSVTIQGEDLSGANARGGKPLVNGKPAPSNVRLPEPGPRRATSEDTRTLVVNVTPSTLEAPPTLPGSRLPYTRLLAGYGPPTQYALAAYDARAWGPVIGITQMGTRAGWNWSDWGAKEWLAWPGVGRLDGSAEGYGWDMGGLRGVQTNFGATLETGESANGLASLRFARGQASTFAPAGQADLLAWAAGGQGLYRHVPADDHVLEARLDGQYRVWGRQAGVEAYVKVLDRYALSPQLELEGSLGGGHWGREPIIDPGLAVRYRPSPETVLRTSLRTASELPDFKALYAHRPNTAVNDDLNSERVEGWAQAGGSHRLTERLWLDGDLGLRRSHRHIYWADRDGDGLWAPLNAAGEQWSPTADVKAQLQWTPAIQQDLTYGYQGTYPLGSTEHKLGTSFILGIPIGSRKLDWTVGLAVRNVGLSALQTATATSGIGAFLASEAHYALTNDWSVGLSATELPVFMAQPAMNYFAPSPSVIAHVQYEF